MYRYSITKELIYTYTMKDKSKTLEQKEKEKNGATIAKAWLNEESTTYNPIISKKYRTIEKYECETCSTVDTIVKCDFEYYSDPIQKPILIK